MSLFILPASVSDLTQLQLGIEFVADTGEATTEAGLINQTAETETVNSYAFDCWRTTYRSRKLRWRSIR